MNILGTLFSATWFPTMAEVLQGTIANEAWLNKRFSLVLHIVSIKEITASQTAIIPTIESEICTHLSQGILQNPNLN